MREARVDWHYRGKPDFNVGTGATPAERALPYVGAFALMLWIAAGAGTDHPDWPIWQWVLALVLAFDIGGGAVANSLNSCKRYYHSPVKPEETGLARAAKNHVIFVGLHVHTIIVHAVWSPATLWIGAMWYIALLLAAATVMRCPLYLARPIATAFVGAAVTVSFASPVPPGFEWLVPLLFLKIVLGHCTREEPYRPAP